MDRSAPAAWNVAIAPGRLIASSSERKAICWASGVHIGSSCCSVTLLLGKRGGKVDPGALQHCYSYLFLLLTNFHSTLHREPDPFAARRLICRDRIEHRQCRRHLCRRSHHLRCSLHFLTR